MRAFIALARLRLLDVLRSPSSAGFVVLFPLALLLFSGLVFADGHPFETKTITVVAAAESQQAQRLLRRLGDDSGVRVEFEPQRKRALSRLAVRQSSAVVEPAAGRVLVGPRERLFGLGLARLLSAQVAIQPLSSWGYVHFLFPGLLTFTVMLSGLFATGYTMVLYRQNRFLKKLATTPLPKLTFLSAQVSARSLLVLAQIALMVGAAFWVFAVPLSAPSLAWLVAVSLLGLLTFMGAGFALACAIKNPDLVVDLISAVNLPLVLLSEIFFPLSALPKPLAAVGSVLPSTEMVRLLRAVLFHGETDLHALGSGLLVLCGWTVATFAIGLLAFKWHA